MYVYMFVQHGNLLWRQIHAIFVTECKSLHAKVMLITQQGMLQIYTITFLYSLNV
jgi:hypothetical protein